MTNEEYMAGMDIRYWYAFYKDLCPNCGCVLKDMHPMANLYPHWTGACKKRLEADCLAEFTGQTQSKEEK